ncbi:mechanosensitive ion channel domain-containing protein [Zooshikella sp. RANM57]|uniref:mechanosensitive ion channel domain-containing protein n=1 Tax=Zooshikella sp. RANM57 TaxID=3425863 RepID=UPI003D6E2DFE
MSFRVWLFLLFSLCVLNSFPQAIAEAATTDIKLPSKELIKKSIDSVDQKKLSSDEQKELRGVLQDTLQKLEQVEQEKQRLHTLRQEYADIPRQIRSLEQDVRKLSIPKKADLRKGFEKHNLDRLEDILSEKQADLSDVQSQLDRNSDLITITQKLPETTQAEMAANQKKTDALNDELRKLQSNEKPPKFGEEREHLIFSQIEHMRRENSVLRLKKRHSTEYLGLLNAKSELLTKQAKILQKEIKVLDDLVITKRREETQKVLDSASEATKSSENTHPILKEQAKTNIHLSKSLLRVTDSLTELNRKNSAITQQLQFIKQIGQSIDQQTAILSDSPVLGKFLRQQKQALPKIQLHNDLPELIANLRFDQFQNTEEKKKLSKAYIEQLYVTAVQEAENKLSETNKTLEELKAQQAEEEKKQQETQKEQEAKSEQEQPKNPEDTTKVAEEKETTEPTPTSELSQKIASQEKLQKTLSEDLKIIKTLKPELEKIIQLREKLLDNLISEQNKLLSIAITLQINQQELKKNRDELAASLEKQLFWIASNKPIDSKWFKSLPKIAKIEFRDIQGSPWEAFRLNLIERWPLAIVFTLLLVFTVLRYRPLKDYQLWLTDKVGKVQRDDLMVSPKGIAISAFHALPIPLFLMFISVFLKQVESRELIVHVLSEGLSSLAVATFALAMMHYMTKSNGVCLTHFKWSEELTTHLNKNIRLIALALIPLAFITRISSNLLVELDREVIGQIPFMITALLLSLGLFRLLQPPLYLFKSKVIHYLIAYSIIVTPLVFVVLTILGYFYTALTLQHHFINSFYLVSVWVLIHALIVRNLHVAARRLAFQRALEKRAASRDPEQAQETFEEPVIDMESINNQSIRLINATMLALLVIAFYAIWSNLLPVFEYLDTINLWEYQSEIDGKQTLIPLNLSDALLSIIIFGVSLILSQNLPGLLEISLLSKMKLRQGTSYAVTTIVRYFITGVGTVMALSTLGLEWSKLQWLVAALSVGLGFGLQEIFANFVSGLIILFERPVRIGDTVTIGDQHGSVSRIRIRATTITDWDNKEIIIPNKVFVTDRLINWSLSSPITRIIINVGVAYGSDLEKTKELLLKAAHEHPKVLHDPEPQVLFTSFGDSTLDHELRAHVQELRDRLPTSDQLLRAIDRMFKEHNIEIAFPQRDLHIRSLPDNSMSPIVQPKQKSSDDDADESQSA